jgi:hypothetical protein
MKTIIIPANGVAACIKSFDALVPIGTPCEIDGVKTKIWSHAGRGPRGEPCVFVDDRQEPVPLRLLKIEGVEMVSQREMKQREKKRRKR